MNTRTASSLSPSDIVRLSTRPGRAVVRAAAAHFLHRAKSSFGSSPEEIAAKLYGKEDPGTILTRAAVSPATTGASGWASQLVATSVNDFIGSLSGVSAAVRLLQMGVMAEFSRRGAITIPGIAAGADDAGEWVQEGAPIPVKALTLSSVTLTPRSLKCISVFSVELADASTPTIENVLTTVMREATALALDASLLGNAAASDTRPAGLLNGVAALTPGASMDEDLAALADAVAGAVGSGPIVFVADPATAARIKLAKPDFAFEVLASAALAAGTVVAVAPNALASAFDPVPRFDLSDQATLVMNDAPDQISVVTGGSPATAISGPVKSLWQSGLVALRLILQASWGTRTTGAVAHVSAVGW